MLIDELIAKKEVPDLIPYKDRVFIEWQNLSMHVPVKNIKLGEGLTKNKFV